jgi:predicted XRE-type DNA-binding protein
VSGEPGEADSSAPDAADAALDATQDWRAARHPIRGHRRDQLIRLLATKEYTQVQLGEMFGVCQPTISKFKSNNLDAINAVATKLDDEFAGLWIATKRARIAEYQQLVEDLEELLLSEEFRANGNIADVARAKLTAFKQASEELGQLPGRVTVQHSGGLDIRVNGVDVEALR